MGTDRLKRLADEAPGDVAGGVAALAAELRDASWAADTDVLQAFPSARNEGGRIVIDLDEAHSVAMLINYDAGCVLIEEAGRSNTTAGSRKRKRI